MLRLGLSTVISLLLLPAGFSQTVARKPLPTEALEKYDPQAFPADPFDSGSGDGAGTRDLAGSSLISRSVHKLSS